MRRTGEGAFHADGPGGTAGTKHHQLFTGRIHHLLQTLQKPFAIGVLANVLAIATHGAVHRADDAGRFAEPIEMLDDGDLVRDGTVKARPIHCTRAGHGIGELLGRHLGVQITIMQPMMAISGFDHFHRGILRRWLGK